jgi:hypothetical protein
MKDALEFIGQRYLIKILIDPAVIPMGVDPVMQVKSDARGVSSETGPETAHLSRGTGRTDDPPRSGHEVDILAWRRNN